MFGVLPSCLLRSAVLRFAFGVSRSAECVLRFAFCVLWSASAAAQRAWSSRCIETNPAEPEHEQRSLNAEAW